MQWASVYPGVPGLIGPLPKLAGARNKWRPKIGLTEFSGGVHMSVVYFF